MRWNLTSRKARTMQMPAALFVDLPNFCSCLLKSGLAEPRFLKHFFLDWLHPDLLAGSLAGTFSGILVFHSDERIGPSSERISGKYLRNYLRRVSRLERATHVRAVVTRELQS